MSKPKAACHFCGATVSDFVTLVEFESGSGHWKCEDSSGCLARMAKKESKR
jgi:hypothetical protein